MTHAFNEWQETQNDSYLVLLQQRLQEPKLTWVNQFVAIINSEIKDKARGELKPISVNDYGCNVGHFFRGIEDIGCEVNYHGFDISETYLKIAKKTFGAQYFHLLDIADIESSANIECLKSNVSVISATLEHIENYESAMHNVFSNTSDLVVLRTFVGETSLKDKCRTIGAKSDYLIRQFTIEELTGIPLELGWCCRQELDLATKGESKMVCNSISVPRKQPVHVFSKETNGTIYA